MKKTALFTTAIAATTLSMAATEKPNIVFILADDLGLGDISFYAKNIINEKPFTETPNIDALAEQGIWFTDGHSACALCAPTRYAVMSGNNNYRSYAPTGVWSTFAETAFKPGHATLGTVVRDAGYNTGFIGKWHLGGLQFKELGKDTLYSGAKDANLDGKVDMTKYGGDGDEKYCGFDYSYTLPCGVQGPMYLAYENQKWAPLGKDSKIIYMTKDKFINPKDVTDKGPGMGDTNWQASEITKVISAKAVDFIKENGKKDEPFFLYYCSPTVHLPHCPTDEFDGRKIKGSNVSAHLDLTADLDMQVKRIVDAVKATGEFDNTLFFFSTDNGGLRDGEATKANGYQPGHNWNQAKNSPLEGGHRVPTFAVWKNKIKPGTCDELVVNQDMVATFAALVGTKIPAGQAQDSNNVLPLFLGKKGFQPREYWANQAGAKNEVMYRKYGWKLIIQSNHKRSSFEPVALYNIEKDPREKKNQFTNPEFKPLIKTMYDEYMQLLKDQRPTAPSRIADMK